MMNDDVKEILVSKEEIENICERLGKKITEDYKNSDLVVVGLLSGCLPFMSDLIRHINLYIKTDYMKVSSYFGTESTGTINIKSDLNVDIQGKDVLIVDDIIDTGLTISETTKYLLTVKKAKSVKSCCLLDKKEGRTVNVEADYVGTDIPKKFVIGYGLDYNGFYRNLPYVGVLKEEVYQK